MNETQSATNQTVELPLTSIVSLQNAGYKEASLLRGLDTDHIEHLVSTNLIDVPPVTVAEKDGTYILVDGYHRLEASKQLQRTTIKAFVRTYQSDNDLIDAAFQANMSHGLTLSRADKEKYVLWLYRTYPDLSQTEMAKRVRLNKATVSRMLARNKQSLEEEQRAKAIDAETGDTYASTQLDHTKKLVTALTGFFENEQAFLGSITGTRSEQKRAKALAAMVRPGKQVADMYDSLANSLTSAATIIRSKIEKKA